MPQLRTCLFTMFCCLLLSACVTAEQKLVESGGQKLTGEALIELFADKTHYAVYPANHSRANEVSYIEYYRPDGRLAYEVKGELHQGQWIVEGDHVCFLYDTDSKSGIRNCQNFYRDKDIYRAFGQNSHKGKLIANVTKVVPGNAENYPVTP